jgi:hypothetical protein
MKNKYLIYISGLLMSISSYAEFGRSDSSCQAVTTCYTFCRGPYGPYVCGQYPLTCWVSTTASGDYAGTQCTWEAGPDGYVNGIFYNGFVRCTGMNSLGEWGVFGGQCH